jgi:hypothetical protein
MAKKKQKTPKGHECPIPKRSDFEKVLDAVAKPKKPRRYSPSQPGLLTSSLSRIVRRT